MTDRSVMPDYAAAILRSTCEAATAAIAERGRLDDQEIRSFIGGVADCFDADPSDVLLALGLDDLDETRNRPRLGGGHACCGCGGGCDSGMPCPMAYACRCRTLPMPEADDAAQPLVTAELPLASQDPPPAPEPANCDADALDPATSPSPPSAGDEPHPRLRVVPCTITRARAFIAEHHRHLAPPLSGLFAVGVARGDQLVGVAMVGRPVARALQDGGTVEVTRVCTLGDRNACSMLLSACRRSAAALGYRRVVTYTLASEPGTSLRAAGWREVGRVRGRSWNCAARPRADQPRHDKRRWEAPAQKENHHVDA